MAGSPDLSTEIGTMVVATTVVDVALEELGDLPVEIPARFDSSPALRDAFLSVPGGVQGLVLCWEGQVASPSNRPPATAVDGEPVAVDWESAAVAQVAQMWGIPWVALKVVSDHGEHDRMKRVAVAAKRPLQWAAEVFRRAGAAYLNEERDEAEDHEDDATSEEEQGEDRETSTG